MDLMMPCSSPVLALTLLVSSPSTFPNPAKSFRSCMLYPTWRSNACKSLCLRSCCGASSKWMWNPSWSHKTPSPIHCQLMSCSLANSTAQGPGSKSLSGLVTMPVSNGKATVGTQKLRNVKTVSSNATKPGSLFGCARPNWMVEDAPFLFHFKLAIA